VDFALSDVEQSVRDSVATLLQRLGPPTARYDLDAEAQLRSAGFLGIASDAAGSALLAAMVVEDVARSLRNLAIGSHALALPALGWADVEGPVTVALADGAPARFVEAGGHALVVDGGDVRLVEVMGVRLVAERWGFQTATPVLGRPLRHREGGAAELAAWWRLSTSAEIVGLADAALRCVADHLGQRVQFGRSLTAQQALRHRLAVLRVRLDGSRLLTYRAAWSGADAGQTLEAAAYTASTGRLAVRELHQMCGAIGLTEEYALQRWTTRIVVLCSELGGAVGQQRALARHRWPASSGPFPS
jgi:hypothetical protein